MGFINKSLIFRGKEEAFKEKPGGEKLQARG